MTLTEEKKQPKHLAIVMDGNGRWAKKRGLPRMAGHKAGAKVFQDIAKYCNKIGVQALTVYVFSTENWNRPAEEVDAIMNELRRYLKDTDAFKKENIRLIFTGDRSRLAPDIRALMQKAEKDSENATGLIANMAINYGGRDELLRAAKKAANLAATGELNPENLDEATFASLLDTAILPPLDLFIRPGGEKRISNFLLWQCAYAEFVFTDTLWPDFRPADIDAAIAAYQKRDRRFGGLSEEEKKGMNV